MRGLAGQRTRQREALLLSARERVRLHVSRSHRAAPASACGARVAQHRLRHCGCSGWRSADVERPSCAATARGPGTPGRCHAPPARSGCGGPARRICPSDARVPASGTSSPATMRSKVVLPQPEGPLSTTRMPSSIDNVTPFKALRPSKVLKTCCSSTAFIGVVPACEAMQRARPASPD